MHILLSYCKARSGFFMKKLKYFTVVGGAAVLALGAAAHFFYEWSGNNFFVGMFSPVNESVWEHMKLAFFPMLLFSFAANLFLKKDYPGAASSALCGALLSTALIPVIFYTYSGVLGYNSLLPDILTFVFSVLTGVLTFFAFAKAALPKRFFRRFLHLPRFLRYYFLSSPFSRPKYVFFKKPVHEFFFPYYGHMPRNLVIYIYTISIRPEERYEP